MSTVGPSRPPARGPGPLTDTRTVVIVLLALALSLGAGIGVAVPVTATAGMVVGVLTGLSATGASTVVLVHTLHALIRIG